MLLKPGRPEGRPRACGHLARESRFAEIESVSRSEDEGHAEPIRGRTTTKQADFDKSRGDGADFPARCVAAA